MTATTATGTDFQIVKDPMKGRFTFVMLVCLVIAGAVVGRAAIVQLFGNARLETMSKRQFQSKVLVRPRRGTILDRNGEPLAVNVESHSLAANPSKIQNKRTLARILSKATDIPYAKLLQRLSEKREFIWIKRHLSESDLNRFKKWQVIDAEGDLMNGLWLVKESQRVHPHGELAAQVLGDVNIDSEGMEGVELWQDERMRGKVVSVSAVKDALGRPTFIDAVAAKHVQDGEPVILTLDASLQYSVEQELRSAIHRTSAKAGTVIVMNAVTGELLALANYPSFNPNEKAASPDHRRNRAFTDGYEPGSTLKPVLISSALSSGWHLTDRVWGERGHFVVQGKRISEAEAHEKFEWISLKKLIQVSSNVGAAKVALRLGADKYYQSLKSFGFGAKTSSGFPGEISGQLPARKSWQPLTLANIGFGQGILVTPIQMVRAYAAFANGGWLVQPTLVKPSQSSPEGVEPPRRVLTEEISRQVVNALESVTEEGGSGTKAALQGYTVAGKTGTAQKIEPGSRGYARGKYVASFIGFAVEVDPKIVIFTSLDEPQGVYYGGQTAAPLFREILNAVASRFSMPAKLDAPVLATGSKVIDRVHLAHAHPAPMPFAPATDEPVVKWQGIASEGSMVWRMPSLRGLTPREAIRVLQGHKFKVEMNGIGIVKGQAPEEGHLLTDGETLRLTLGEP